MPLLKEQDEYKSGTFVMNNLLKNKIDHLFKGKNNRNETWCDLVTMLDSIVTNLKLNFDQEVLLTKIINKLIRIRNISKDYCKDIVYLLNNNGLNLFESLSKGEIIANTE